LAAIQQRDGAFEKAAKTYQQASEVLPQNAALKLKLADLYDQHLNDPAKAFDLAKQAHKLSADDPQISHLLGRLAFQNKDYKWAASLLQESSLKLPDDPELSYDLAWSYFSLGQLLDAQAAMQKCCAASHSESGNASRKQAAQDFLQLTAAAQDLVPAQPAADRAQKLLATAPDYVPALLVRARAREQQAAFGDAAQLYEKVLAQYPSFLPAVRSLALLYFARLNDEQRAYDYATKARESFPDDPEIAKALGVLSYRRKDYSRSAQLLEQSARGRTQDAEVFFYLGMARYQLNQRTQSKEKLQRALALNSAATFADDARRVLHEIQ
jgi:tetratricopeptide (TPR) repeat protein